MTGDSAPPSRAGLFVVRSLSRLVGNLPAQCLVQDCRQPDAGTAQLQGDVPLGPRDVGSIEVLRHVLRQRRLPIDVVKGDVESLHRPRVRRALFPLGLLLGRDLGDLLLRQRGRRHAERIHELRVPEAALQLLGDGVQMVADCLMVLCCDPRAIAPTAAASARRQTLAA